MSHKLKDEVFKLDLPHNESWVLMAYADFANDDGDRVFPSKDRIAWITGYSERAVRDIRDKLKARGVMIAVAPARWIRSEDGTRRQRPPEFRIDLSAAPRKPDFRSMAKTTTQQKRVADSATQQNVRGWQSEAERVAVSTERVAVSSKMGGSSYYHLSETEPSKEEPVKKAARARESFPKAIGSEPDKPLEDCRLKSGPTRAELAALSKHRNSMVKSGHYSDDELSDLLTMSIEELEAFHKERVKQKSISGRTGRHGLCGPMSLRLTCIPQHVYSSSIRDGSTEIRVPEESIG